ncbi:Cell division control protein 14 [Sugiyamaella lignohabitans]|uniref:Cell division control protein 14 n=1 Tax=Sugiyamaella lignohabitans TaxID=796027 RepID=A0A167DI78_9ASCO|nr:Cell division control protein 14 [Sugiyamaella lignohabitans]ANB12946.1 Cell division control protein 14 [Sugiyamaella lignohabitans]
MVHEVENIRLLESVGGLKAICDLFKHKDTAKDVKLRILEFLFFYLIPETSGAAKIINSIPRKTTEDKQEMLGKYLSNVNGLVRELHMSKPFGDTNLEW